MRENTVKTGKLPSTKALSSSFPSVSSLTVPTLITRSHPNSFFSFLAHNAATVSYHHRSQREECEQPLRHLALTLLNGCIPCNPLSTEPLKLYRSHSRCRGGYSEIIVASALRVQLLVVVCLCSFSNLA